MLRQHDEIVALTKKIKDLEIIFRKNQTETNKIKTNWKIFQIKRKTKTNIIKKRKFLTDVKLYYMQLQLCVQNYFKKHIERQ